MAVAADGNGFWLVSANGAVMGCGSMPAPLGGTTNLTVERPAGVAFKLSVVGGITKLDFDGVKQGSKGGVVSFESPGASRAQERYALELVGGATKVVVSERR